MPSETRPEIHLRKSSMWTGDKGGCDGGDGALGPSPGLSTLGARAGRLPLLRRATSAAAEGGEAHLTAPGRDGWFELNAAPGGARGRTS